MISAWTDLMAGSGRRHKTECPAEISCRTGSARTVYAFCKHEPMVWVRKILSTSAWDGQAGVPLSDLQTGAQLACDNRASPGCRSQGPAFLLRRCAPLGALQGRHCLPGQPLQSYSEKQRIEPRNRSWTRPSGLRCGALARRDDAAGSCPQGGATPPACRSAARSGA